jgi:hypothetical protein
MPTPPPDLPQSVEAAQHRILAAKLYNSCWELLDKRELSEEQHAQLLSRAHASAFHWGEVIRLGGHAGPTQMNVADWMLSRVYAVIGAPDLARIYGLRSLKIYEEHREIGPFYGGFSHEALARAARLAGEDTLLQHHLRAARKLAEPVADASDREWLIQNLQQLDGEIVHYTS